MAAWGFILRGHLLPRMRAQESLTWPRHSTVVSFRYLLHTVLSHAGSISIRDTCLDETGLRAGLCGGEGTEVGGANLRAGSTIHWV